MKQNSKSPDTETTSVFPFDAEAVFGAMFPDPDKVKEFTEEWMKAVPMSELASMREKWAENTPFADLTPSVANLSTHPAGAVAAGSAVAMGMMSQFYATMFGSMAGAVEAAQKLSKDEFDVPTVPSKWADVFGFEWDLENVFATPGKSTGRSYDTKAVPAQAKKAAPKAKPVAKKAAKTVAKTAAKPVAKTAANKNTAQTKPATPAAKAPAKAKPVAKAVVKSPAKAKPAPVAKPAVKTAVKPAVAPKKPVAAKPKPVAVKPAETVALNPLAPIPSISDVMPEDFKKPAMAEQPKKPDDLKLIAGVGPKLEKVLNGLGIWTYDQISKWTVNEVAWVDDYLQFKGRIERDDWIAQADALARGGRAEYVKVFGKEPR